ncbi:hypothetical protein QYM36_003331 [Artemia franciscana]|uniref:Uncharacterized protein n=1 Tax=Artemia franciscana TaxID=6661 RepID=A0AA88IJZ1_ARTSF|nr:hypothetical protein QYM36_003331 [Artemia franciscana]
MHPPHIDKESSLDIEFHVHSVVKSIPVSDKKTGIICEENQRDPALIELTSVIQKGWPIHRHQYSPAIKPYWNMRDELSSINGIKQSHHP